MPSNEQQPGQGFFDRFFSNNPESLQEEIHQKLNSSPPPRTVHEEMDDMLKAFGFPAGFRAGELRQSGENEGHPFVSAFQNSSYRIHQDNNQVQVEVDMPGAKASDMKVEVLNTPACVIQWSGQRGSQRQTHDSTYHHRVATFSHRVRLGNSVDCEQLSANLNRGVLRLTAPIKQQQEEVPEIRSVQITERDEC